MGRAARRFSARSRRERGAVSAAQLLRRAAAAAASPGVRAPSLPLPGRTPNLRPRRGAARCARVAGRGLGLVAARPLAAGTTVVCEKAVAMVLDAEIDAAADGESDDGDDGDADAAGADGALLVLRLCSLVAADEARARRAMKRLFPRTPAEAARLRPWRCGLPGLDRLARTALAATPPDLAARLPHVARYNALDCHTGGERLSYPLLAESRLAGVALFAKGSLFNHGDDPNVARWHVGDVCCFRTNRFVAAGEELTMAYCDSALLEDGDAARTALAHFDFVEQPAAASRPLLGVDEQRELMALPAGARLEALAALGDCALAHDRLQQHLLRALALRDPEAALDAWIAALEVADGALPPHDEQVVALRVAAAKAALAAGDAACARVLFRAAAAAHGVAFAPGAAAFRARYAPDLDLATTAAPVDAADLWRLLRRGA